MLLIECPHCGPRDECEFHYGGEAHIARPATPEQLTDEEWSDYVFKRSNPKGWHRERWCHEAGCGRWFNAVRSTVTHAFHAVYPIDAPPMPLPEDPATENRGAGEPESGSAAAGDLETADPGTGDPGTGEPGTGDPGAGGG